ncbi:lysophospholipid acyltransferase family protein [Gloeobacter kilaueensis]|uniref:1-acyl-sn-glycerol-3-phosphate acyltransferase n=1 Tax=Gloeobacter kilaueensis (strain ATCC BAA-2537 / CCAP 1431/1 / ULC 316 / JS1) TaxID=1183438 RepID=U5QG92_GLOK1|nr:lysophospholipid acyltransferase family protein [Gloeobacter kilaueensis]AGY57878.1 1-acyl-sn-glycerol-3-phosphate acyltransferase [Gloeobacter kilaueensis JS1]
MKTLRPEQTLVAYHLFKWLIVSPILHTALRVKIAGEAHVPATGAVILASSHASHLDPVILANCARRPVAFMAKEELFTNPVLSRVIRLYGAFPVKRGSGDRGAIRAALEALDYQWAVGIFLNGTRTPDGSVPSAQLGAAMLAAKTQVPIVPVAIAGSGLILPKGSLLPRLHRVSVCFGPALAPPESTRRAALETTTAACAAQIQQLLITAGTLDKSYPQP